MLSNILDRISLLSLFTVIVLLPVFFLPYTKIPVETSKGLLLVIGVAIAIISWVIARLSDGKISMPRSWLLLSGFGVLFAVFVSALFSGTNGASFFGVMLDTGTVYFMLVAFLLMLFSSIVLNSPRRAKFVFWGVIFFSISLFIFQLMRLFAPDLLSFGVLTGKTDNLLGSWNTFGLFAGFFTTMTLFIVEFFSVSKIVKFFLGVLAVFSIILSATVNFSLTWGILGVFALIIFVYKILFYFNAKRIEREKRHFPLFSFIVFMVSLLFFMSGQFVGRILPDRLGLSSTEVRPTFGTTMLIMKNVLMEDPVLGVGPNKFGNVWGMYKPSVINSSQFWDVSFNTGSGLLPTFLATNGFLGILSWLIFFFLLVSLGVKSLFQSIRINVNWEASAFFIASMYLFVASFFYATGGVVFLLAFAFTGIFIGLSARNNPNGRISISFLDDPRKSFFSIIFLVILMIFSATASFQYIERLASVPHYRRALSAKEIETVEASIEKAVSLYQNDLYLRTYAQVYLAKVNVIVSKGESLSEKYKADLQTSFDKAVKGAELAVFYDKTNYLNYNALGNVYYNVGLLGVKDVYSRSIESFKIASLLNPLNPGIKLSIARVFFAEGNTKEARDYAKEALTLKPDYLEALVVMSQIEKSQNNNALALSYAEKALSISPDNQDLADYVRSLKNGSSTSNLSPLNNKEKE